MLQKRAPSCIATDTDYFKLNVQHSPVVSNPVYVVRISMGHARLSGTTPLVTGRLLIISAKLIDWLVLLIVSAACFGQRKHLYILPGD